MKKKDGTDIFGPMTEGKRMKKMTVRALFSALLLPAALLLTVGCGKTDPPVTPSSDTLPGTEETLPETQPETEAPRKPRTVKLIAGENFEKTVVGENTLPAMNYRQVPPTHEVVEEDGNRFLRIPIVGAFTSRTVSPTGQDICEGNADKSLILKHKQLSEGLIVTSVDYRWNVPEGKEGAAAKVQMQLTGTRSSGARNDWASLYAIYSAGTLNYGGETGSPVAEVNGRKLAPGEWYNFTTVSDLKAGTYSLYIDGELWVKDAPLGNTARIESGYQQDDYRNMVVKEDGFIVAKVNKNLDYDAGITFDVDNAVLYEASELEAAVTVGGKTVLAPEGSVIPIPAAKENGAPLLYCEVTTPGGKTYRTSGTRFAAAEGLKIEPVYFDVDEYAAIFPSASTVSVFCGDGVGLNVETAVDPGMLARLNEAVASGTVLGYSFGTLIAPSSEVKGGLFPQDDADYKADAVTARTGNCPLAERDGKPYFEGKLTGIQIGYRDQPFTGVGYLEVRLTNGEKAVVRAPIDPAVSSASPAALAEKLLGKQSGLTEEQRFRLEALLAGTETIPLTGDAFAEAFALPDALYFRYQGTYGCYCRLTDTGDTGWRFETQKDGFGFFREIGAAQAFSLAMGEEPSVGAEPLTWELLENGKVISVTGKSGSTVRVDSATGALTLLSPEKKELYSVTGVRYVSGAIRMEGKYSGAVYGLGERLDTVNKTGTSSILYSYDGWNDSAGTYTVIPLVTVSSGGGLFVNSYNRMTADFGKMKAGTWHIDLEDTVFDCYLIGTGKISDAIGAYTALTGHADIPEDWNAGAVICRYSPDLKVLKGTMAEKKGDTWFLGYGVVDTVKALCEMGAKPSAVLMEGWDTDIFKTSGGRFTLADRDGEGNLQYLNEEKTDIKVKSVTANAGSAASAARKQALTDACDYLDALGIKAMLYMHVGVPHGNAEGWRDAYAVHLDVYESGKLKAENVNAVPDIRGSGNPDVSPNGSAFTYLDITNPEAWEWYINNDWMPILECGVDGVKIDFCEEMPDDGYRYGKTKYEYRFCDPSVFDGIGVHHGYPTLFISMLYRDLSRLAPDGFMVLSRGGGIGSQRNPFMWAGDQTRSWDKLDDQVMAMLNSGLSGVPFMTYDMSGYQYAQLSPVQVGVYNTSTGEIKLGTTEAGANEVPLYRRAPGNYDLAGEAKIFLRGVEFTAFSPCVQSHGFVKNAYDFDDETQRYYALYMALHNELQPYLAKYEKLASETGYPVVAHPVLKYQDDKNVCGIRDEYLLGDGLLVAPVLTDGDSRRVYLPKGEWIDLLTGETVSGGKAVTAKASIGQIPVYLDTASPDADALRAVFSGETWTEITGGVPLN